MIPVIALVILLQGGDVETVAYYPADVWGQKQCELDMDRAEKYFLTKFSCSRLGES